MNVITLSPKICMSHLLLLETFDRFLFIEGKITTFNTFEIDGFLQTDFFDTPPESAYSRWKDVRDFCFRLIKGKRNPFELQDRSVAAPGAVCRLPLTPAAFLPTGRKRSRGCT